MNEKGQKVIIGLLVINLAVMIYAAARVNQNINNTLSSVSSQIGNLNSQVSYLQSNIGSQIDTALTEQGDKVADTAYEYRSIDAQSKRAAVDVTVRLEAVSDGAAVVLSWREEDGNRQEETLMTRESGLTYGAQLSLALDRDYAYDIIERTAGGGETLLNTGSYGLPLYSEFYGNRIRVFSSGRSISRDEASYDYTFSVHDFGLNEYGLDRAVIELCYEDRVVDTLDVTDRLMSGDEKSILDQYNLAVAAGEIEPGMEVGELKEYLGEEQENGGCYYYLHTVTFQSDYPELQLDRNKAEALRCKLIITCKDGYEQVFED